MEAMARHALITASLFAALLAGWADPRTARGDEPLSLDAVFADDVPKRDDADLREQPRRNNDQSPLRADRMPGKDLPDDNMILHDDLPPGGGDSGFIEGFADGEIPDGEDHTYFQHAQAPVESSGTWLDRGNWYVRGDLVMLTRTATDPVDLSSFVTLPGLIPISKAMNTQSAGFGFEPGMRLTLGHILGRDGENRDHSLEFTFLGLHEWVASHAVSVTPANIATRRLAPTNQVLAFGFTAATEHRYRYWANLNSYEVNGRVRSRLGRDQLVMLPDGEWQREVTSGRQWGILGGVRYLSVDEEFNFAATDGAIGAVDSTYDIKTHNRLFGVQLGAEVKEQHANWSFGVHGKAGAFVNFADQVSDVRIFDANFIAAPSTSTRGESANDEQLAMVAEVGLTGAYQLRPNMAVRLGYDFMYIQGLAVAPEQLTFDSSGAPKVIAGSFAFLNGATFAFEYFW